MPKVNRGGRRTSYGGYGGYGSGTFQQSPQAQTGQNTTLNQATSNTLPSDYQPPQVIDGVYVDIDNNYNDWLYLQHKAEYRSGLNDAMKQYISQADMGGGYSMAQWLNYKLENGQTLDANEQYIYQEVMDNAYDLGQNAKLFRADHDQVLKNLGISDYTKMTEKQLQNALVGQTYSNKTLLSTSYDKDTNPFYHLATKSNSGVSGGREIYYNYNTKNSVKVVQGDRRQTEIVIAPGQSFKITGVRYDNSTATPRNGSSRRRLIIDVEVG